MADMSETQCWLVDRDYEHEDLITIVYATPDGRRKLTSQRSSTMLLIESMTAGKMIPDAHLEPVRDDDERRRYAREAGRMAEQHDPDDTV